MIESAEEFVRLRASENQEEYVRAAHDEAPIEVWYEVVEKHPDMAFWVAQNKTVPYELLEFLADHSEDRVRSMVASKNKLKEPLLLKLASDSSESVRMSIARHKKATSAVLTQLTGDTWGEIAKLASERIENGSHK
ncbi:MAG: HEAT repeat domain-containing protein [Candidatus Thiodiazotropha sp. (ex Monitilora ramsayi)]|nr:HEAT repeat domain-containing protein [Candidatus Thiodiazotropha sp. (ex Monitilora ramsayi)]